MKKIDAVLVVEGKMDHDFISSFLDCDIVITNGSEVSRETIEFVRKLSQKRKVIVLTDPDFPGKRIRDILNQEIPGLYNAFVPKELCIKGKKVGIAESNKKAVMEALSHLIKNETKENNNLTFEDLFDLGLMGKDDSKKKRKIIQDYFHIGECNGKTLLHRLNMLGVSKEELGKVL